MKPEDLTTWALDEASPEDQAAINAKLREDAALRRDAAATKDFCALLTEHLGGAEDTLSDEQRTTLATAQDQSIQGEEAPVRPRPSAWWRRPGPATLAAAAAVTLMGGLALVREGHHSDPAASAELASGTRVATAPSLEEEPVSDQFGINLNAQPEVVSIDGFINYDDVPETTPTPTLGSNAPEAKAQVAQQTVALESLEKQITLGRSMTDPQGVARGMRSGDSLIVAAPAEVSELAAVQDQAAPTSAMAPAAPAQATPHFGRAGEQPAALPEIATATASTFGLIADGAESKAASGQLAVTAGGVTRRPELLDRTEANANSLSLVRERRSALERMKPAPAAKPRNESYTPIHENPFMGVAESPLSTFSIDVDTASYANVRRFLNDGQRPPPNAVRIEELVNYFRYDYEQPEGATPFSVNVDVAEAPWNPTHRLARIGLMGRQILEDRQPGNFVFLVDVSGSMNSRDKLELVQKSLRLLAKQLGENDRVSIVTYAGNSGLALPSTSGADNRKILSAIDRMKSGGSTHGSAGIRLAYEQAVDHFIEGGVNRVILCTDGDFNVGISDPSELERVIAQKAKSGVFLSVLGFGTGNLKDETMETLADKGNGNYAYIDSVSEARKVLVEQLDATLVTIAKDVKIQVEFNPAEVQSYRLIGYENRLLAKEDFNDDTKDAGEIGAGHTVTALYELVPVGATLPNGRPIVDDLKYQAAAAPALKPVPGQESSETMTVKLRYKQPDGDKSQLIEVPVTDQEKTMAASPKDFRFAAAVAGFGLLLRDSAHKGTLSWDTVRELASEGKGKDKLGYRGEFLQLIDKAQGSMER